jgi:hypothetical protein
LRQQLVWHVAKKACCALQVLQSVFNASSVVGAAIIAL